MPPIWNEVHKIIRRSKVSVTLTKDGQRVVADPKKFKPLPATKQEEINDMVENDQKLIAQARWGGLRTFKDVKNVIDEIPVTMLNFKNEKGLITRTTDMFRIPAPGGDIGSGTGGIRNYMTQAGVPGQDPSVANSLSANLWLSPQEASAVYSQKGLPETIIRKKSQSILLNRVRIKNSRLSPKQLDIIEEDMVRTGLAHLLADAVRDSLVYGGALLFPMFNGDSPLSVGLPIQALARYGFLRKGMISYFVSLDRWNVVHTPSYNPTAKDYLMPERFFIPFLGSDVHSSRCARIVTAPQPGYWGNIMTYGWGLSDIPGWIGSVMAYASVMKTIPTMINQMSIIARSVNADGLLATEGSSVLEELFASDTLRMREMGPHNVVNMDVVGTLQSIQRDFTQVPELVRLLRQGAAADAVIPEELLWSSERGAFSSGDTTDSAFEKQSEGTRYIHVDVARQTKPLAQLQIINALGTDEDIIAALPYTTIEFDNPRVTNAKDKAEIAGKITKGMFDMVAAGLPMSLAVQIGQQFADDEFQVSNEVVEELNKRQEVVDARATEKHEAEIAVLEAQAESAAAISGASAGNSSSSGDKKGHSYSDRLEQRKHEKVAEGGSRKQGLQKARGKGV